MLGPYRIALSFVSKMEKTIKVEVQPNIRQHNEVNILIIIFLGFIFNIVLFKL